MLKIFIPIFQVTKLERQQYEKCVHALQDELRRHKDQSSEDKQMPEQQERQKADELQEVQKTQHELLEIKRAKVAFKCCTHDNIFCGHINSSNKGSQVSQTCFAPTSTRYTRKKCNWKYLLTTQSQKTSEQKWNDGMFRNF